MAMFEQALSMWSPFSGAQGGSKRPGQPPGPAGEKAAAVEPAKKDPNDISELKAQLANMQQKIDKLSEDRD
jgi:polyhydroxyalkanoate synthesis regulator protein